MHQQSSPRTQARQLTLAAYPAAVPWVRRLAGQALTEWGLDGLSGTVLLLLSELVTNAVRASAGATAPGRQRPRPEITVTLSLTGSSLLIEVWDAHPAPAVPQHPDATAESGRGLLIVEALASSWGQRAADGGKVVWCKTAIQDQRFEETGPPEANGMLRSVVPAARRLPGRPLRRAGGG